jgi:hypothetical protein
MPSQAAERFEDTKQDFPLKDFLGVNTQATRTSIKENEFAWLENVMPIGYGNGRCVPHQGSAIATIAAVTITYMKYANIAGVDYQFCFNSSGGGHQVNLSTGAVTLIAAGGTFTGTVAIAQWKNERILIIAGNNYWDWDGATLTVRGGTTAAPTAGSTIGTFAGRVWIGNGRTITFSAPDSFTDFQTASAGGSFIITDETLHSSINSIFTANSFLYIVGDASFNVISDVRVSGGVTLFSNTNVSALIGTNLSLSIFSYYRDIVFATKYGFYKLSGITPQKISDNLDGIIPAIDFTKPVSGDVANIFNILCMAFLFQYNDTTGVRPLLAIAFNGKWFFASQGNSLTLVSGGFLSGTPALYGTDGTNIYKLFSNTTNNVDTLIKTALWPHKNPTRTKQTLKAGVVMTVAAVTTSISLSVDTEVSTIPQTLSSTNTGQWFNNSNTLGDWINAAAVTGQWVAVGFQIFQGDIDSFGRYVGYTISSSSPGYTLNGILMQFEKRDNWNVVGA